MKERSSNFELLKVILTLMIIVLHYCNPNMGGIIENVNKYSFNYYIVHFIESACIIAVNTFIIIEYIRRKILGKILDSNVDKINYRISCD